LVELHGGTVHVDSPGEGLGATFTVRLPVRAVQVPARAPREALPSRLSPRLQNQPLAGLSVLVVDDEPDARELIATVLEQAGARALVAGGTQAALELLAREQPDVLLSDIGMSGSDGYALMREVRSLSPERGGLIPAAALTAYSRAEDARQAIESGFQRHVSKPVEPEALIAQVAALAGRPDI
jgi:CheY-like chemotaxis protein